MFVERGRADDCLGARLAKNRAALGNDTPPISSVPWLLASVKALHLLFGPWPMTTLAPGERP
jgi:hypothetical protein